MNTTLKAGLVAVVGATIAFGAPLSASAADLYGSIKDGYTPAYRPAPAAGPCYARGDIGYSWSGIDKATYQGNAVPDPDLRGVSLDDGAMYEVGLGCGSGSRGLRADVTFGFRTSRDFKGDGDIVVGGTPIDPYFKTKLDSYTVMFNGYYDFGNFRGFIPYVGAGVGVAMHKMGKLVIEDSNSPNPQHGDTSVDLAWSVMAGVGYQITPSMTLDVGYRYINMGDANSSQGDWVQAMNPKLVMSDIDAHEIKVGLRYAFGSTGSCCDYAPMK
ncbi:MAG: outer membrane protein [Hyphomicrobiaceae bacterium]